MTASAFVVHWNSPDTCNSLCTSLLAHNWIRELIIIDNHSDWQQFQRLIQVSGRVKTLRLEENLGWGGALNVALRPWPERAGARPEDGRSLSRIRTRRVTPILPISRHPHGVCFAPKSGVCGDGGPV